MATRTREILHRYNHSEINNSVRNRSKLLVKRSIFDNETTHEPTTKKGFKRKKSTVTVDRIVMCCTIVIALLPIVVGQYSTRDPRFYSREGDYNYKWPNPGDPDYR